MLRSLEIQNYRNLRHLTIEKLGRVNLLVGKNNTGKTSMLEAVAIHAEQGNELPTIRTLLRKREEFYPDFDKQNSLPEKHLSSLLSIFTDRKTSFYKADGDEQIYIGEVKSSTSACLRIEMETTYAISRSDKNGIEYKEYITLQSPEQAEDRESRIEISMKRPPFYHHNFSLNDELLFSERYFAKENSSVFLQFIDAKNSTLETIQQLWNKVALTEWEDEVIKALQIIEPSIIRFSLIGEGRPVVRLKNNKLPLPLRSMGDGINRILTVILATVSCESNGYLLIDEFENGLHYSVQEKLWEIIFYLAERLNIQVFATTHSLDCVEAFSAVLNVGKQAKNAGVMIRLENYEGSIEATVYDADEIQSTTRVQVDPR